MDKKPIDFMYFYKKRDKTNIYPGDTIIWQDYDGLTYNTKVIRLLKKTERHPASSMPIKDKIFYTLDLEDGLCIDGGIVREKTDASDGGL